MIHYHASLAVSATTIALSGWVGALAWRRRPEPGATCLAAAMFATCWWIAALGIGMGADSLSEKLLWVKLEWVGVVVLPIAWFLFALEYTGRSDGLSRPSMGVVGAGAAAVVALVWTNPRGLVRRDLALDVVDGIAVLEQSYEPLFWVLLGGMLTLASLGTAMLLALAVRSRSLYRGQAIALSLAAVLPLAGTAVFLADLPPWPSQNAIPVAFTLSGMLHAWAVSRYRLLERLPVPRRVTRDIVIEQMDAGVVVIDARGEIVDANSRAATLLGTTGALVGTHATERLPGYDAACDEGESTVVTYDGGGRWLEIGVTPIRTGRDRVTGRVAVLSDVTDRRHRQQRLDVLDRVLRHNLRNEINVMHSYADRVDDDEVASVIKERASDVIELADTARDVERVLEAASGDGEPVDLSAALKFALADVEGENDDATVDLRTPDRDVYCHRIVEPIVANLVENILRRAEADEPTVTVRVRSTADDVRLDVAAEGADIQRAELRAVRDDSETPLNHANGLRLWLVVWGTQRIGGSVTFHTNTSGSVVTLRVARRERPHEPAPSGEG